MEMKVLVSGASGFVGRHVVAELRRRGIRVLALSRGKSIQDDPLVEWVMQDFRQTISEDNAEKIMACDRMIHLAWSGLPDYENAGHLEDNVVPQYRFLHNLTDLGVKDITVAGTCLEYGMRCGAILDSDTVDPQVPYAVAKDSLHRLLRYGLQERSFRLKWVRLFYMFGEGQAPSSLYAQLIQAIRSKQEVFRMSGGEQVRDFLPVTKVAGYLVDVCLSDSFQEVFNCSSGRGTRVIDFVRQVMEDHHASLLPETGYYPYPAYEAMDFYGIPTEINEG